MAITFPTTLDVLSNPTGTDLMENATSALDHDVQHSNANDAIEALEAKVGANSSAVTTSHDYKLSGVTGSDKAASKTGTETLTNKTLTAPQINMGSDANGDLLYRNGSGVTSRLGIGSTDQILAVQSGLPAWIANPSATAASSTAAGIVELATTAETTTGTDATRAVTPQGLHDMTSLAGATWFLDEDAMTSDSATKTASQQSIKAYVDGNTFTTNPLVNTYYTYEVPMIYDDASASNGFIGWAQANVGDASDLFGASGAAKILSGGGNTYLYSYVPGTGSAEGYVASDNKQISVKFRLKMSSTANIMAFGLIGTTTTAYAAQTEIARSVRFVENGGTLYAQNSNGTTSTTTDISSGITRTNWNTYEFVLDPGVNIKYYVNGTLVATHTTNLPTTGNLLLSFGLSTTTQYMLAFPGVVKLEL